MVYQILHRKLRLSKPVLSCAEKDLVTNIIVRYIVMYDFISKEKSEIQVSGFITLTAYESTLLCRLWIKERVENDSTGVRRTERCIKWFRSRNALPVTVCWRLSGQNGGIPLCGGTGCRSGIIGSIGLMCCGKRTAISIISSAPLKSGRRGGNGSGSRDT